MCESVRFICADIKYEYANDLFTQILIKDTLCVHQA